MSIDELKIADDDGGADSEPNDDGREFADASEGLAPGEWEEGCRLRELTEALRPRASFRRSWCQQPSTEKAMRPPQNATSGFLPMFGGRCRRAKMANAMAKGCRVIRYTPRAVGSPRMRLAGLGRAKLATKNTKASPTATYITQRSTIPLSSIQSHVPPCLFAKKVHTSGMKRVYATSA